MFYFHTTRDAPNARVVAVNVNRPGSGTVVEVIPESNEALEKSTLVGDRLIAQYLKDVHSVVSVYSLTGDLETRVELPGMGTVEGFDGHASDTETFYSYTDFTTPPVFLMSGALCTLFSAIEDPCFTFTPPATLPTPESWRLT